MSRQVSVGEFIESLSSEQQEFIYTALGKIIHDRRSTPNLNLGDKVKIFAPLVSLIGTESQSIVATIESTRSSSSSQSYHFPPIEISSFEYTIVATELIARAGLSPFFLLFRLKHKKTGENFTFEQVVTVEFLEER